jgi:hypothetical protein
MDYQAKKVRQDYPHATARKANLEYLVNRA